MEGGIHYARWVIQGNSNVFWTYQFTGNVSDHNKQNPVEFHQHWQGGKFY